MAGAHRAGALVHGAFEELERDANAIGASHELHAGAAVGHGVESVAVRGKVEIRDDDLRPLRVIERARDPHEAGRHVRLDGDLVARRAEHPGDAIAKGFVLADPVVVPRTAAELGPLAREALDPLST